MGLDNGSKLERNYSLFIKRYLLVFLIDPPHTHTPYEKCHQDRH